MDRTAALMMWAQRCDRMLGDRRVCRFFVDSEMEFTFCVSAKLLRRMRCIGFGKSKVELFS
jgi:hypothetical protein